MKIIFGLGNPGEKYQYTRHNIGFVFADKIKEAMDFPDFTFNKKFNAEMFESVIPNEVEGSNNKIILVKPQTFMNNSGEAVRSILDFYKLAPHDIIVIHDDLDIDLGSFKIADDSRSAGHNGIQDIIDKLDTQKFKRIRVGIGKNENIPSEDYVLQKFSPEEKAKIESISENILEEIKKLL